MVFKPTQAIKDALAGQNINCDILERDGSSAVVTGFDLKSGDQATIHFISLNDNSDVAIRVFHFAHTDPAHAAAVREAVNQINCQFRYAKFTLHDDGDVNVEMDVPQETVEVGKVATELLIRGLDIMAEAAPVLKAAGATLQARSAPAAPAEPEPPKPEPPKKHFSLFGNGK